LSNIPQNKRHKIVRIIARLNVGGPARHVVWLTQALQNEEFDSVLVSGIPPEGEEDMGWFADAHGVRPHYIEEMSRELSAKDAVSLWKVYREFKREKPDVVHTHTAKAGTIGRVAGFFYRWLTWKTLAGKPRPVRFVHTYHGHVFHSYYGRRKTQFFLFIEKALARLVTDKIIVISSQQYSEIHEQFAVGKAGQFQIVPLGLDLAPFENSLEKRHLLREELGAAPNELLVGLVGRLTEIKNHSLFLKVAALYKKNPDPGLPPMRFVVIGDGHLRASLEKEAADLGVADVVAFLGNRNDTDVFYAGLDIVALSSYNEGTPLSLIEAMANALPVISTEVGGVIDLVGSRVEEKKDFSICERGICVAPNEAEAFFQGLIYLAQNEQLRAELGRRGKSFVVSSYSKERLVTEIKDLYCDLFREKG
jgi:glycosyltransferase involved in cell wall biosynthesis